MLWQVISGYQFFPWCSFLRNLALCFLSACLLVLSYPRSDIWIFAWIGLVPFFFALENRRGRVAFGLGMITGILFFAGTLFWFVHVTLLGAILLILYLAVYFGLFAVGYCFWEKKNFLTKLFLLPSLWVVLEFVRGHLLSGFGWVSLGHSQYQILPLIQIADTTGVSGISFLVVMVNVFLKEILENKFKLSFAEKSITAAALTIVLFLGAVLGYGFYRLSRPSPTEKIRIAIIQANIPQEEKWESSAWPVIMSRYLDLTRQAAKDHPDLIIWPETAFPGFVWEAPQLFVDLENFVAKLKIPLLLGMVTLTRDSYYNSAVLISAEGEVAEQYDKLHLVPFGEYIPLRHIFPFLSAIVPIGDFTPGNKFTPFPLVSQKNKGSRKPGVFSALICFEDTIPEISSAFTRRGSNLLVNITNDAWFQDTKAPYLHLQASLFRTVENHRGLVRVANTGASCFIDPSGRVIRYVEDSTHKKTYVAGFAIQDIGLNQENTFYSKYGDIFTYLCFGGILMGMMRRR